MSPLLYRLLGQAVWAVALRYLRRKHGRLLLPRKVLFGGVGALVLGAVVAVRRSGGASSGQLRP